MKRVLVLSIGLALAASLFISPVQAKLETTIAVSHLQPGSVSFAITRSVPIDDVVYVTNECWDGAGNKVLDRDTAVMWGTPTSLVGATNPMPTAGVTCTAYVTIRPWANQALATVQYQP